MEPPDKGAVWRDRKVFVRAVFCVWYHLLDWYSVLGHEGVVTDDLQGDEISKYLDFFQFRLKRRFTAHK